VIRNPGGGRTITERGIGGLAHLLLLALCCVALPTKADHLIPAGSQMLVASGLADLACTNLIVGGVLDTGTGSYVNVRDVIVAPSGIVQGSGSIHYSGTLSNSGTIQPSVQLVVNPPTNQVCPGPGVAAERIPTLGSAMLLALAMLLLGLATYSLRWQEAPRRHLKKANK
jgi:hypothetical protein